MLTISAEALEIIHRHKKPIYLNMPKLITSCCFDLQECPTVHFGKPHDPSQFQERIIQDVMVLVPHRLPHTIPLTITVSSFLGFKRLVLEGWCLA
jgi:hypothetical protein